MNRHIVWLERYQGGGCGGGRRRGEVCGRVWISSIGILKMDHLTEADVRNEIVVEKKIGGCRYGE